MMKNLNTFIPCGECDQGYIYSGEGVTPCACRIAWRKKELYLYHFQESNLPHRILNYSIDQYVGASSLECIVKLKKYVDKFDTKYNTINLFLWSKQNSTQKSTVSQWVGNKLLEQNKSVYFIYMDTLIQTLIDGKFSDHIREEVEHLLKVDFLIIDDCFDTKKVNLYQSKYQISYLDNFLRTRLENFEKATCFTSNLPIEEIGEMWGVSMQELILRNIPDPMEFKDSVTGENKLILFKKDTDLWSN